MNRIFSIAKAHLMIALAGAMLLAPTPARAAGATADGSAAKVQKEVKKLDHPTSIGGYLCYGYVRHWDDGSLNMCRLAADAKIQGLAIPKETMLWFYPGGKQIQRMWLSRGLTIQGVECYGGRGGKVDTVFYPSGKLKATFLPRPATIQGVACKDGGMNPVYFFESGRLKQGTLAKEQEIGGKRYATGLILVLDESGKVVEAKKPAGKLEILRQIFSRKERKGQ